MINRLMVFLILFTGIGFAQKPGDVVVSFLWGVHVTNPQKVSATIGLIGGRFETDGNLKAISGFSIEAEAGLGGARGFIGHAAYFRPALFGYSYGVSVLRTWRNPWLAKPEKWFVGISGDASFFFGNFKLGLYRRTDKNSILISTGFGIKW
ncbi:hypothetical protein K1X84_07555 [bacterium]|nr:hypothetical protein [bacterium]